MPQAADHLETFGGCCHVRARADWHSSRCELGFGELQLSPTPVVHRAVITVTANARLPLAPLAPDFAATLERHGLPRLERSRVTTLQVNVGRLCNMACQHCHVDAGPKRTEVMPAHVADRVLELVRSSSGIEVVDFTGGAPELNPEFRRLVRGVTALGRAVIDRCNLSVLFEPGQQDLHEFLARHRVRIVASLPCYQEANVDGQRGKGAFERSLAALRRLNAVGYGIRDSGLELDLVYNPTGPSLPPSQTGLQERYKRELFDRFRIQFNELLTITNMPINRFEHALARSGKFDAYMQLLVDHFNAGTVPGLMCRSLLSVGYDGRLYDCDFNQMLGLELGAAKTIWDVERLDAIDGEPIATQAHCFGCTAGAGSSCGGALSD